MKIQVSNLVTGITDEDLRMLFECFGEVASVEMGGTPGRALIEMLDKKAAKEAIAGLNGQNLKGSDLAVGEGSKRPANNFRRGKKPHRRGRRR